MCVFTGISDLNAGAFVPGTAVVPCRYQYFKVPTLIRPLTCALIPWTALFPGPLQHLLVPSSISSRCCSAGALIPRAPLPHGQLEHLEVPSFGCFMPGFLTPRAALRPRPLQQQPQATSSCSSTADALIPGKPCCNTSRFPPRPAAQAMSPSSQWQPCSLAQCRIATCPPSAASPLIPGAAMMPGPPQHLQVTHAGCRHPCTRFSPMGSRGL